jgi:serine/threonine-protein phosphatase PP1 catalytic subunit
MTSVCFGAPNVEAFLQEFGFDLVCRGHQAVMGGFDFPFGDGNQTIVTVFSAPNYCCEFENKGAVLHVDKNLFCRFTTVEPKQWHFAEDEFAARSGTPPRMGAADGPESFSIDCADSGESILTEGNLI